MNSRWIFAIIVAVSFVVYALTAAPGVMFTDSGELAGACASLGVAHPTGYPLFVMLGHIWSLLPLPFSIIYKLNLFAAFCTALSAGMVFLLSQEVLRFLPQAGKIPSTELKGKKQDKKAKIKAESHSPIVVPELQATHTLIALATALSYTFARTVWAQATSIEVYSLHLLMMTTVLYLGVKGASMNSRRLLMLAALALGLSFTNHLTTIALILPLTSLFFYRPGHGLDISAARRKDYLILLALVISCAVVYISLVLRSGADAWFNWGAVHRSWESFSYHVFGKQYGVWLFSDNPGEYTPSFQLEKFIGLIPWQTGILGVPLFLWGIVQLWQRSKQMLLPFALMLLWFIFAINYCIHDIDSYFLICFIALLLMAAVGAYTLVEQFSQYRKVLVAAVFLLPLVNLGTNWQVSNQRDNVLVHEYVKMMVDPLPPNAVLISQQWDNFCSAFWYLQQVEGYRRDVVLIEKELLRRTWYPGQLLRWYPDAISSCKAEIDDYMIDLQDFEHNSEAFNKNREKPVRIQRKFIAMLNAFVEKNITQRPIFATQEIMNTEEGFAVGYGRMPYGMAMQLRKDQANDTPFLGAFYSEKFLQSAQRHHSDHLEKNIALTASISYTNNGAYYLVRNQLPQADSCFSIALQLDKQNRKAADGLQKVREMMAK